MAYWLILKMTHEKERTRLWASLYQLSHLGCGMNGEVIGKGRERKSTLKWVICTASNLKAVYSLALTGKGLVILYNARSTQYVSYHTIEQWDQVHVGDRIVIVEVEDGRDKPTCVLMIYFYFCFCSGLKEGYRFQRLNTNISGWDTSK